MMPTKSSIPGFTLGLTAGALLTIAAPDLLSRPHQPQTITSSASAAVTNSDAPKEPVWTVTATDSDDAQGNSLCSFQKGNDHMTVNSKTGEGLPLEEPYRTTLKAACQIAIANDRR